MVRSPADLAGPLPEPELPRSGAGTAPWLSVVVPAHSEEGNIAALYDELRRVLNAIDPGWELIIVDDGSTDRTWARVAALQGCDPRVCGVRLSRNFGHQSALLAGLSRARGAGIVMMDADLQHPPAVIPRLIEEWQHGAKIVHTVRLDSAEASWFKRVTSRWYYRLFSFLSGVPITPGTADFRLVDRQVLDELLQFQEAEVFLRGLVEWVGYDSARVTFQAAPRHSGRTKYTLRHMLKFAWTGITSFSVVPLRAGIVLGLVTSAFSFTALLHALWIKWLEPEHAVPGWATIVALIGLLFGILFVLIGLLGEYLVRILVQVRQRPRFLVSETVGFAAAAADASAEPPAPARVSPHPAVRAPEPPAAGPCTGPATAA